MSTSTDSERMEIRNLARELARKELLTRAHALDEGDQQARAHCRGVIQEAGLNNALLAEADGGAGMDAASLIGALQELAAGDAGSAAEVLLSNIALGLLDSAEIAQSGEGTRWTVVPAVASGEVSLQEGRLQGRIEGAIGALEADGLILLLDSAEPSAWVISATQDGVTISADEAQLGLRGAPAATIELNAAEASLAGASLDEAERAQRSSDAQALLDAGCAAIACGVAQRAYELAYNYAHDRQQGGVAIIEHEAVSDMLVAMLVRQRSLAEPASIGLAAEGRLDRASAAAIKVNASDAAMATAIDAVQIYGGTGYMVETGVEKLMRDAKYCQMYPTPNWVASSELMAAERSRLGAMIAA